jgi:L-threonylcarbamoyladenylate synthase
VKRKRWLEAGQVIGIPTETVYGLAGNALSPAAVARIFEVKNRPTFDPLIVHSSRIEKIAQFVAEMPPAARRLAEAFWPGPLTLLLKKADRVPDLVTSGLDTVAVRIPTTRSPSACSTNSTFRWPPPAPTRSGT